MCRTLFDKYNSTNKTGYNTYREWTKAEFPCRHCSLNINARETKDDLVKDGRTNFTLRVKEQALPLTLQSS
jgi:hypothetical protein